MSDGFQKFRVLCPNCSCGLRTAVRFAAAEPGGYGYVAQHCRDCDGNGWLPLGSGEWKRRLTPKPDTPT
jgi:hypothetical protein